MRFIIVITGSRRLNFLSLIMLNSSFTGSKMFRERNDKLAAIFVLIYVST